MKSFTVSLTLLTGVSLYLASSAFADPAPVVAAPPAAHKTVDPKLDSQTVVCHREEELGTRLGGKKVCHTRAEWAEQAADARQQMDRIQQTPQTH